jgi:predicted helicase
MSDDSTVTTAQQIGELMARKAKILAKAIHEIFKGDDCESRRLLMDFREEFGSNDSDKVFSDFCSQTIVFSTFVDFMRSENVETFSIHMSLQNLSNFLPLLKKMFSIVLESDSELMNKSLDDIADMFAKVDRKSVLEYLVKLNPLGDPILDFYQNFFGIYDNQKRHQSGAWYTPKPVVDFMVRTIDKILRDDFQIPGGIADSTTVNQDSEHRVQILDPATGTGTFLAGVIEKIHEVYQRDNISGWDSYVHEHLLPRLNGIELMQTPYILAHLKLETVLGKTGYHLKPDDHLQINLANTLEMIPTGVMQA